MCVEGGCGWKVINYDDVHKEWSEVGRGAFSVHRVRLVVYVPRLYWKVVLATSDAILCWCCQACSATAEVLVSPFFITHWRSLILSRIVCPNWPMYVRPRAVLARNLVYNSCAAFNWNWILRFYQKFTTCYSIVQCGTLLLGVGSGDKTRVGFNRQGWSHLTGSWRGDI